MGKNELPPCGYKPALQFYLRKVEEGGDLLVPGEFRAAMGALTRRTCLVLVHGFNNSYSGAADAYLAFRRMEKKWFSDVEASRFEAQFGDTFWPGDADWGFFDKLDFLIYPRSVHTAVEAGRALADLLLRMPNLQRVDFIAHSLGCRVVLEALSVLREEGSLPQIGRVVLMAAAVPSEMLEPGGRFYDLMYGLWRDGIQVRTHHSLADRVLHYAFPPGQTLAGITEASGRALGRYGPSVMMPGWSRTISDVKVKGADHSDYWGGGEVGPSEQSTKAAGAFLGLGEVPREVSSVRDLASTAVLPPRRPLGTVRPLGAAKCRQV